MQQRYCTCGKSIWVNYLPKAGWEPKYWFMSILAGGTVDCCPSCGRQLDINMLR